MAAFALNSLIALLLLFSPGAYLLGRRPPGGWSPTVHLVAVALGPALLSVEYLALRPFQLEGWILGAALLLINLPAVARTLCWTIAGARLREIAIDAAVAAVVFLPIASHALEVEHFRAYGWHNLMQLAAIYSVDRSAAWPLDLDFAGQPLGYPWLGLLPLAVVSKVVDASPTMVFLPLNYLFMVLWVGAVRLGMRDRGDSAERSGMADAAAVAAAVLFAFLVAPLAEDLATRYGVVALEQRATPMTEKFFFINAMTVALPLLSALVASTVPGALRGTRAPVLRALLAASVALFYPLLAPAALLYLLFATLLDEPDPKYEQCRGTWNPNAWLRGVQLLHPVAVGVLVGVYALLLRRGGATGAVVVKPTGAAVEGLFEAAFLMSPLLVVAALSAGRGRRVAHVCVPLFAASYALVALPKGVQYKWLYGASVLLLPLAAEGARALLRKATAVSGRLRLGPTLACSVLAAATLLLYWSYAHNLRMHRPPRLTEAPGFDERRFRIAPADPRVRSLVGAVRATLPEDVVLVSGCVDEPLELYLDRPLFVAGDSRGAGRLGFAMPTAAIDTAVKGYSSAEFLRRRAIRDYLLHSPTCDPAKAISALNQVGEKVAIVSTESSACLRALRAEGTLRVVHSSGGITAEVFGFLPALRPRRP